MDHFRKQMRLRLATVIVILWLSAIAAAQSALVIGVTDGDTVTVLKDWVPFKVRLNGIDAPETRQPFGTASKKWLSGRLYARLVTVRATGRDRYGRITAWLLLGPENVCISSVNAGMSWWYRKYAEDNQALRRAEQDARKAKLGIWSDKIAPIPPWEWRNSGNASQSRTALERTSGAKYLLPAVPQEMASATVYVTSTGQKFHRASCRFVGRSKFPMSLKDALDAGYKPCGVCRP